MAFFLGRFFSVIRQERLDRLFVLLVIAVVVAAYFVSNAEGFSIWEGLWWSIVTVTTVGYGDVDITSDTGRVVATLLMLAGLVLVGTFSASIATVFIENRRSADAGLGQVKVKDHIIICEWNSRAREVLREIRADPLTRKTDVVIISGALESKPVDDVRVHFVKGVVDIDALSLANISRAKTVVVLGDDRLDAEDRDAKTVLTTLTVESLHPEVYSIVEVANTANSIHCRNAMADEIIVSGDVSSSLVSRSVVNHGASVVISDLLSVDRGDSLSMVDATGKILKMKFLEAFTMMKEEHDSILLGIRRTNGAVISNPKPGATIMKGDRLIVVGAKRPRLR